MNYYYGLNRIGVNLDCARVFYNEDLLKKYIDLISSFNGDYLQLHLSDNEHFNLENHYLGITTDNAHQKDNIWYRNINNQPFISIAQFKDLINYGKSKNVEVYPEIDLPAHTKSIYDLLKFVHPNEISNDFLYPSKNQPNYYEINYYNYGIKLIQNIIREYLSILPNGSHFGIGGDECIMGQLTNSHNDHIDLINFFNQIDDFITQNHLTTVMYNDNFFNQDVFQLWKNYYNHDILVNYWSMSGSVEDTDNNPNYSRNLSQRENMQHLNQLGFKTVNCNSDYLFLVTNKWTFKHERSAQIYHHIQSWNPLYYYGTTPYSTSYNSNNYGTAMSIWSPDNNSQVGYNADKTYELVSGYIKEFGNRINQLKQSVKNHNILVLSQIKHNPDGTLNDVNTKQVIINRCDNQMMYHLDMNDPEPPTGYVLEKSNNNKDLMGKVIYDDEGPYISNPFWTLYYSKIPTINLAPFTSFTKNGNDGQHLFSINVQGGKSYWISFYVNRYDGAGGVWARSDWYPERNSDGSWRDNDIDPNHYEAVPGNIFKCQFTAPKSGLMPIGIEGEHIKGFSVSNLCLTQTNNYIPINQVK